MSAPRITLIAALDEERGIGKDGGIPWKLSADLRRFKELTMGHPVIMGRKTFESIGTPLAGRKNIVITRQTGYEGAGATVVGSFTEALEAAGNERDVFVIGGSEIYRAALPRADRLLLTQVDGTYGADTFFPEYEDDFQEGHMESREEDGITFRFVTYERGD